MDSNAQFSRDDVIFRLACKMDGIEPTTRQASKYRRGNGLAHVQRAAAIRMYHDDRRTADIAIGA